MDTNSDVVLSEINSPGFEQYTRTIAGLPLRVAVLYALLIAIAFSSYVVLWPTAPIMVPDSGSYLRAAQDLSDFHLDELQERTPGYPLLLLLTQATETPNRLLFFTSLSLHFATIWLLATVLYRLGLSATRLHLFALILLLPPFVEPAGYVLTENLTQAMLVAALVSLVFWQLDKKLIWLFISAAAISYSGLTRPTYQILALAIASWLVIAFFLFRPVATKWRHVLQASLILIAGSILLVGGYAYYNYRNFGYFGVTYRLGISLSQKTVSVIERLPADHSPVKETLIRYRNADLLESGGASVGYISAALPELADVTGLEPEQLSKYMLKLNLILIQKAPLQYLLEVVRAFVAYCFPASATLANFNSRAVQFFWAALHFLLLVAFAYTLVLLFGAAIYIRHCARFLTPGIKTLSFINVQAFTYGLAGTIVIYTAAISCFIDAGDPRHRVPTDAIAVFMIFLGMHLWERLVDSSRVALSRKQSVS